MKVSLYIEDNTRKKWWRETNKAVRRCRTSLVWDRPGTGRLL